MAGKPVTKRPIVFTWAEIQKYPTPEARYAETLPFGFTGHVESCECYMGPWARPKRRSRPKLSAESSKMKTKCIQRTGERWAWFSAARDTDDERGERLGTLGYLPWEIRQMILAALIRIYEREYNFQPFYVNCGCSKPLNLQKCWSCCCSIRLASPSTKAEFEHCYFTNTRFFFERPSSLRAFLNGLSVYQQSLLRYFDIEINHSMWYYRFEKETVKDWMACFALLPPNLKHIQFHIWNCPYDLKKTGEEWLMCYLRSEDICETFGPSLNVLGKRARRCAAKTKIGLCEDAWSRPVSGDIEWVRVLDEVEPWSNDWLELWEEDRKFDIAGVEPPT